MAEATLDLRSKTRLNFLVLPGEEWGDQMEFTTIGDEPISLVGATATFTINGGTQVLTIGSGLSVTGTGNNILLFEPDPLLRGSYPYSLRVELSNTEVYTITGIITASND